MRSHWWESLNRATRSTRSNTSHSTYVLNLFYLTMLRLRGSDELIKEQRRNVHFHWENFYVSTFLDASPTFRSLIKRFSRCVRDELEEVKAERSRGFTGLPWPDPFSYLLSTSDLTLEKTLVMSRKWYQPFTGAHTNIWGEEAEAVSPQTLMIFTNSYGINTPCITTGWCKV